MMKTVAIPIALGAMALLACGAETPPAAERSEPATPPASNVVDELQQARVQTACTELQMLRSAVEMYTAMKGECPRDLAALAAERMIDRLRDDPWGHAYQLRCAELELRSAGPDGEPGNADDVVLGATGTACAPK